MEVQRDSFRGTITRLPEVYGGGKGYLVKTEGEFSAALKEAWTDRSQVHIIQAKLAEGDASMTLLRLAERFGCAGEERGLVHRKRSECARIQN